MYRKHHSHSSDEFIVISQTWMSQQKRISELIKMNQWQIWEGSSSYSVESEIKAFYNTWHSRSPHKLRIDECPNSSKPQGTTIHTNE